MFNAEVWVAVAFVVFLLVVGYLGVHEVMVRFVDQHRDKIKNELDEARRLKEEAAALLAQYQRKRHEADEEAAAIIAGAQAESERMNVEAKARTEEFVARRTKMAEAKIAQAEAQALADVRAAAAEAAVSAAAKVLAQTVKGDLAESLVAKAIDDVKTRLN